MILSIETSAEPASISLLSKEGVISRSFPNNNKVNVPMAEELAQLLSGQKNPISLIIVGAGPGSYSGARVGLATAEAVALTHNCPVITLPSYFGIPKHLKPAPLSPYAVIGDARRGAFFIITAENAKVNLKVLEKTEFLLEMTKLPNTHRLFTFENPEKLPLSDAEVTLTFSSSEELITFWKALSKETKEQLLATPKDILYLRPPNITKAKNPFA